MSASEGPFPEVEHLATLERCLYESFTWGVFQSRLTRTFFLRPVNTPTILTKFQEKIKKSRKINWKILLYEKNECQKSIIWGVEDTNYNRGWSSLNQSKINTSSLSFNTLINVTNLTLNTVGFLFLNSEHKDKFDIVT